MWIVGLKMVLASGMIAFTSWLAGRKPALAGFIIALPISSLLALAFTQAEWRDPEKSVRFAQGILFALPLSATFFLPFLFARQLKMSFWGLYFLGVAFLSVSYFAHRLIFSARV